MRLRTSSVFARLCGLSGAVVEAVDLAGDGAVIVHARPAAKQRSRCGVCGRRAAGYEIFHNRQRRHSSLGMRTPVEYEMLHQIRRSVA